jgi:O-antigen/teichoic acid export membrane protein
VVVGSLVLALFAVIAFFGQHLLNLFGSQFGSGYLTLVVIATGASVSALFADIPYYLQYMGFNRVVLSLTLIATITMVTLAFYLGNAFGTEGVAIAYMLPVVLLFISFRIMLSLYFRQF